MPAKTVIIFLIAITTVFSQTSFSQQDFTPLKLNNFKLSDKNSFASALEMKQTLFMSMLSDTIRPAKDEIAPPPRSKKSPGLAMIYSLFVPGMGQLYTKRFDVGKYFLISEAALWTAFASFTVYGNWLLKDAYNYASTHAGVIQSNKAKDDNFWINIANYDNVEQYNNDMLEKGNYDNVYYPGTGFDFYWDSVPNREIYRSDKLAGDRIKTDRLFVVGAILLNHVISAISAIVLTNKYNSGEGTNGGVSVKADVVKNFNNRVDGIKLNLVKWF
jgi:hypothetical protein